MHKFKVGDRVRFTSAVSKSWWFKAGQEGTISSIGGALGSTAIDVKVDRPVKGSTTAYVQPEHIELVSPKSPKVGDRVSGCFNRTTPNNRVFGVLTDISEGLTGQFATAGVKLDNGTPSRVWADTLRVEAAPVAPEASSFTKTWIVAVVQNGKLAPNEAPRTYSSLEQATKVAREMATRHNEPFVVLETVSISNPPPVVKATTVNL